MSDLHHTTWDVAVVGGGVIGLSVAWRARARGLSVVVLERDTAPPTGGASYVAAGMIAPVAEAELGERSLLALGLESARRWPAFAAELHDVTGVDPGYRAGGTLVVARDRAEAAWLDREAAFRERVGLRAERLLPGAARDLEPSLAPALRGAMTVPDDHAADPRALLHALLAAARGAGADVRAQTPVAELLVEDGRAAGVRTAAGDVVRAGAVLLAAGAWTAELPGVPADARVPVRPLKGQIMRLSDPAGAAAPALVGRTIRYETGYLVPRGDGRYVLGATMEERGFDTAVTAGGAYGLIRDASELVPGVLELRIDDLLAGLRPSTPDNAPVLGAHPALPGLHYAGGHHRNGILLAPVTAELVVAELCGEPAAHPFGPTRFAAPAPEAIA